MGAHTLTRVQSIARWENIFQAQEIFLSIPSCNSTLMFSYVDLAWWIVVRALSIDPFVLVDILAAAVFLRESFEVKVELADDNGCYIRGRSRESILETETYKSPASPY